MFGSIGEAWAESNARDVIGWRVDLEDRRDELGRRRDWRGRGSEIGSHRMLNCPSLGAFFARPRDSAESLCRVPSIRENGGSQWESAPVASNSPLGLWHDFWRPPATRLPRQGLEEPFRLTDLTQCLRTSLGVLCTALTLRSHSCTYEVRGHAYGSVCTQ